MMLKKVIVILLSACVLLNICGCAKKPQIENPPIEEASQNTASNVEIFSDSNITLSLKEIANDGIVFVCKNNTDNSIELFLDVGLDGTAISLWSDTSEMTVAAQETKDCTLHGEISETEHSLMSISGIIFQNNIEIGQIDLCDLKIGDAENKIDLPSGEPIYNSDNLSVEYVGADANGINFKIVNNREKSINVFLEELTFNSGSKDYSGSTITIPAHTQDIYTAYIYEETYFPDDLVSFNGVMFTQYATGGGKLDRFPVVYGDDSESSFTGDEETATDNISDVETIYNTITNLTKADCTKDSLGLYSYNGITFLQEDCDMIDGPFNKNNSVEASVFYKKLAMCLEGFSFGNSWSDYSPHILGYTPASRDEFALLVDDLSAYITTANVAEALITKFETVSCCMVTADEEQLYTIEISDVSTCAEEIGISEEMLAYILGAFHDQGATISFEGNRCIIEYKDYRA